MSRKSDRYRLNRAGLAGCSLSELDAHLAVQAEPGPSLRRPQPVDLVEQRASIKQRQIDNVSHMVVATIALMQMIAAVVDRQHATQTVGVTQGLIEVDHRIEPVALPDPGIHRL